MLLPFKDSKGQTGLKGPRGHRCSFASKGRNRFDKTNIYWKSYNTSPYLRNNGCTDVHNIKHKYEVKLFSKTFLEHRKRLFEIKSALFLLFMFSSFKQDPLLQDKLRNVRLRSIWKSLRVSKMLENYTFYYLNL